MIYYKITATSKEAVGNTSTIEIQADVLMKAMTSNSVLLVNLSTN